ncbi:hypothetical protein V8G54_008034 [Vigna mungo]|uniref:Uncharacterized protein n=1 Tax=Vigna mungo TaxID=3915 RepID=A0AAQ3P4V7_VIGMU
MFQPYWDNLQQHNIWSQKSKDNKLKNKTKQKPSLMTPSSNASPTFDEKEEKQQRNMKNTKLVKSMRDPKASGEQNSPFFSCNILKNLAVKLLRSLLRVMLTTTLSF